MLGLPNSLEQPKRCRSAVSCCVSLHNRQPTDPSDLRPVCLFLLAAQHNKQACSALARVVDSLQPGKTADILRCRCGVHRLAFRLPHCLGRIHGLRLPVSRASIPSRDIYAARVTKSGLLRRLKSASGRQTPCRVKNLLYVGFAAKKRHGLD